MFGKLTHMLKGFEMCYALTHQSFSFSKKLLVFKKTRRFYVSRRRARKRFCDKSEKILERAVFTHEAP